MHGTPFSKSEKESNMLTKRVFIASMLSMAVTAALPLRALAAGGPSGPKVKYQVQGLLGEVVVNPYRIAPLTAIIRNGGYVVTDATVRIVPKPEGQEIKYKVSDVDLLTHSGIPVFGLYADWVNTVEVSYTRTTNGTNTKSEKITESYRIYCGPAYAPSNGTTAQKSGLFNTKVIKVEKGFEDRLYLVNNILDHYPQAERAVWNNPTGGSLEWGGYPQVGIIDTKGELRWYLHAEPIFDASSIYQGGVMMGFRQNDDGMLTWGYGQRYAKYDIMGREVFNRRLPEGYDDFSHALEPMQNGNYLVRVSSANYKRPDGRNVRTVRDVIIEVDPEGRVVDEWNLNNILDPYRSTVIKTLDQGAVCLNIDAKLAGHTMSAEELAAIDKSDNFGDILGTGAGRNWAHVNSVDYDPTDDSIIISSRHQSAIVKIGRDKKVKWIVGSHEGWTGDFAKRLLKPVDASGNPIECDEYYNVCKKDFDWTWTQHTAWRIDAKSDKRWFYLSVFDNGDGRGMEQPALPDMKYSRAVVYKIDQKKMTIEQVWEYGKGRGHEWFSPVTSLTEYHKDKDSVMVYSATAGMAGAMDMRAPSPFINEFKWGAKEPSVEIRILDAMGYQAMPFDVQKAFSAAK